VLPILESDGLLGCAATCNVGQSISVRIKWKAHLCLFQLLHLLSWTAKHSVIWVLPNNELQRLWKEEIVTYLAAIWGLYKVELRKNTKQISVCRALNTKPPKYRYIATF
jgi:hypothetical protein